MIYGYARVSREPCGLPPKMMIAAREQDGDDGKLGQRVLMRAKSNIGPDDGGFKYDLQFVPMREYPEIIVPVVSWRASVSGTAREILAAADATDGNGDATVRREAEDFLLDFPMVRLASIRLMLRRFCNPI